MRFHIRISTTPYPSFNAPHSIRSRVIRERVWKSHKCTCCLKRKFNLWKQKQNE